MTYASLSIQAGGKADNSAKSKVGCPEASGWYAQALRYPDSYLDRPWIWCYRKGFDARHAGWSFLAAKSDKRYLRKE
jgi:hypothetical protein